VLEERIQANRGIVQGQELNISPRTLYLIELCEQERCHDGDDTFGQSTFQVVSFMKLTADVSVPPDSKLG
jgi:hypothetical protein